MGRTTTRVLCLANGALGLGAAVLLLAPAKGSYAFSKFGTALNVDTERTWRTHNVFVDSSANSNQVPDPNFPGWLGADMALWKAASEWGSGPHGTGAGDPTQANLGEGGANFDFVFSGAATAAGTRIVTAIPSCSSSSLLAYVLSGGNNWIMRFCDNYVWDDDPSAPLAMDIQGVGCHEFGHALGLGHASFVGPTMYGTVFNTGKDQRSLEADDIAGLQCIYGVVNPAKPRITGVTVDFATNEITVDGVNFSSTGNALWFSRSAVTQPGVEPRAIVSGLDSPSTTQIVAQIPAGAGPGDVHVRTTLAGGKGLSNGWPVDPLPPPPVLSITGITPSSVPCLIPGTDQTVTIHGTEFTANTTVTVDGNLIDPSSMTFVDDTTITIDMPLVDQLGLVEVRLDRGTMTASEAIDVFAPTTPTLQIANGNPFAVTLASEGLDWVFAGPPGEFHYILGSSSSVPSTIPIVSLDLGNNFSDLFAVSSGILPSQGYLQGNVPLNPVLIVWYFQSLSFSQGTPIPVSNQQQTVVSP